MCFAASILKADQPGKHFISLSLIGSPAVLFCFQPGYGFLHLLASGLQPGLLFHDHGVDDDKVELILAGEDFHCLRCQGIDPVLRLLI